MAAAPALVARMVIQAAAETSSHGIRQCTTRLLLHQVRHAMGTTDQPTNKVQTKSSMLN
jgi:hypothetical protein